MPDALYRDFDGFLEEVLQNTRGQHGLDPSWVMAVGEAFGRGRMERVERAIQGSQAPSSPAAKVAAQAVFGFAGRAILEAVGLAEGAAAAMRRKGYADHADAERVAVLKVHLQMAEQRYRELRDDFGEGRVFRREVAKLFGSTVEA